MKPHTADFKDAIKQMGRELNGIITYGNTILEEEIMSITPHFEANILKSVMKQLDLELSVDIPLETVINCQIGILVEDNYEMLDFGNYVVYSSEKQEDTETYKIVCYDKMLYAMKQNEDLGVNYPITIKNYLTALANKIGLSVANATFYNQDLTIPSELYLGLEYTYRDILDEIAQATGSIIVINSNDQIEVKYPTTTGDTIDEEFLKDTNVDFAEKYGPINSIVLSRAGGSDNVYLQDTQSVQENGLCEVKIVDNQIMNFNNRSDFLQGILAALDGLEYYINDFNSTGIMYYEVGDLYNIQVGNNTYQCLMLNDEIDVTTGIEEIIHTDMPEQGETDYSKADKTDRRINQTYIIVDKQNQTIESVVSNVNTQNNKISQITQTVDELNSKIQDIADITKAEESSNAVVNLTDINESEPIMIKVHPTVDNISYTYPSRTLYPDDLLYPKNRIINFKRTYVEEEVTKIENIPYELPDDLLRYDSNIYDEFYLDYDSETCQITKRCEYFGGRGINLFNPQYIYGNIQNISNISVSQDEKYTIIPGGSTARIELTHQFFLNAGSVHMLSFSDLTNIQLAKINITAKFYTNNGTFISQTSGLGELLIEMPSNSKYFLLDFDFTGRTTGQEFSFRIMLNSGSSIATYETYNPAVRVLAQERVISYPYPQILLGNGDYEVSLAGYDYGYIFVRLMVQNIYTTQFATNARLTSEINQTAEAITSTVSATYERKDIAETAYSEFRQTATSISTTVANNNTKANIVAKINDNTSSVQIQADKVNLQGYVTVSDLSGNGTTMINGNNITTGTINGNNVNVININASNITSGTISGSKIKGGTIDGDDVTIKNLDASKITTGTLSGSKISGGTINGNNVSITNLSASNIKSGTLDGDNINVKNLNASNITTGTLNGIPISGGSYNFSGNNSDNLVIHKGSSSLEGYFGSTGSSSNRRYALAAQNPGGVLQMFRTGGYMAARFDQNGESGSSDIRLKENITNIEEQKSYDIINSLTPIEFTFKNEEEYHRGLSAQEVIQVLKDNGIEKEIYSINKDGYYALKYTELIPDLINCIKYLSKEIETLKGGK